MGILSWLFGNKDEAPTSPGDASDLVVYENERYMFSIRHPSTWAVVSEDVEEGVWAVPIAWADKPSGSDRASIIVNARETPLLNRNPNVNQIQIGPDGSEFTMPSSPEEYLARSKEALPYEGSRVESATVTKVAGMDATRLRFTYNAEGGSRSQTMTTVFALSATFQIACDAPVSAIESYSAIFDAVLESFHLGMDSRSASASSAAEQQPRGGVVRYNAGVECVLGGDFSSAEREFTQVIEDADAENWLRMVAAYARAICQGQQGKTVVIPDDLAEDTGDVGCTYLAYTTAASFHSMGHSAAVQRDEHRTADARVNGKLYRFNFNDFLGQFMIMASRIDEKRNESLQIVEAIETGKAAESSEGWPTIAWSTTRYGARTRHTSRLMRGVRKANYQ